MAFTGVLATDAAQLGNIELGQGYAQSPLSVSVSETLSLTESASYPLVPVSASDTLAFSETASRLRTAHAAVSENLNLVQSEVGRGPQYEFLANRLNLNEDATGHVTLVHRSAVDALVLLEGAGRRVPVSASDVISLTQSAAPPPPHAQDTITLTELAKSAKSKTIADTLTLTEVAKVNGAFHRPGAEAIVIIEAASYFVLRPGFECTYSPFIGASNDSSYTPPPSTPPTLGHATLTLTWPYVTPTSTVVLRNPDFGDSNTLTFTRINQTTRGGTLTVFADPNWPKFQTLAVHVKALSDLTAAAMLQFLEDSLGQEIGLLDWEGRQWRGIITNPDTAVSYGIDCGHSVAIEFEGNPV